jgi:hypothetical protein
MSELNHATSFTLPDRINPIFKVEARYDNSSLATNA